MPSRRIATPLPSIHPTADPLGVLTGARTAMGLATLVGIEPERVEAVAETLAATPVPAPE